MIMKNTWEKIFEYASMPVHGTMSRKLRKGVTLQINEGKVYESAVIFLRRINFDGTLGPYVKIAEVKKDRRVGFPQMERVGDSIYVAWGVPNNDKEMEGVHEKVLGFKMIKLDIKDIPASIFSTFFKY